MNLDPTLILVITIALFIFGAIFGSFTACQARRLRIRELQHKKSTRTNHTSTHAESLPARSICLHCHHQLAWYDNIPIISWLLLRGRCRHCHKKIGKMEFFSEIGLALVFVITGLTFINTIAPSITPQLTITETNYPTTGDGRDYGTVTDYFRPLSSHVNYPITPTFIICQASLFILLLIIVITLWTLLLYDAMWKRLPTKLLTFSIICAIIYRLVYLLPYLLNHNMTYSWIIRDLLISLCGAIIILPGIYFILYKISDERWVGGGDWLLCLALAFLLGYWQLALVVLFLANFLGSIVMLPALKLQKSKSHQIPFGPFLILATLIVFACQSFIFQVFTF